MIITVVICSFSAKTAFAEEQIKDYLHYYQQGDLVMAAKLAEQNVNQPLGRLVLSLCRIHDLKNQKLEPGLAGLQDLFEDKSLESVIRLEAKLSYTRMIQLLQIRGRHKQYDSVNVEELYISLIKDAGVDERACYAALYLTELYFESYLKNRDIAKGQKAIECIESFLVDYTGNEHNTVFLYLYAEKMYTNITEDYSKSLMHLETAYRIGIKPAMARQNVLFKLGRISDIKLHDKETAAKYYKEFLRVYPNVIKTPLIRRYLQGLDKKNYYEFK